MKVDIQELQRKLGQYLDERRVAHSVHVMEAAIKLAELYCPELSARCAVAGLLHDHAKQMSGKELKAVVKGNGQEITQAEKLMPFLLHGKAGAILLMERFGIEDQEVCQAISDHVTGRRGMGMLSKIIYVADQIAQDRDHEGVEELRKAARSDLDQAAFLVARYKLMYIIGIGRFVDQNTLDSYNEYLHQGGWIEPSA